MLVAKGMKAKLTKQIVHKFKPLLQQNFELIKLWRLSVSQCVLCYQKGKQHHLLCDHCLSAIPYFHYAQLQGDILNWPAINKALPNVNIDRLICVSSYQWPISHWLQQLKYHQQPMYADLLGFMLSQQFMQANQAKAVAVDMVCVVPMHNNRWLQRGYNQAHLIAKAFARYSALHYCPELLIKSQHTTTQVQQTASQRRKNLADSFALATDINVQAKHILLIDDVITTGATVATIAKLLRQAGVATVTVATVAIALLDNVS